MSRPQQEYGYEETQTINLWSKYPVKKSYVVWSIAGTTLLGFIIALFFPSVYKYIAMSAGSSFRIWQLLTAAFTGAGVFGLLFSITMQLFMGIPLEHEWSGKYLAIVYLFSAVGSNLAFLFFMPQGMFFASPVGAVSGLLAAAFFNMANENRNLYRVVKLKLKTLVLIIMAIIVLLLLFSCFPPVAIVPVSGFLIGILFCLAEKKLQRQEADKNINRKKSFRNIEID